MIFSNLLPLFPALAGAVAGAPHELQKHGLESNISLYAYGGEVISGLPVYADASGRAVVAKSDLGRLSTVAWTIDTSAESVSNVTLTAPNGTTTDAIFYIETAADVYNYAAFAPADEVPSGAITHGFVLYGNDLSLMENSTPDAKFWAISTTTPTADSSDAVWTVAWNTMAVLVDDSFPLSVKKLSSD